MEKENKEKQVLYITHIETELGLMVTAATNKGICMFEFADYKLIDLELRQLEEIFKAPLVQGNSTHFDTLKTQLDEYFKGKRRTFDIPLDLAGTEFQKKVWLSLLKIPYGETTTYGKQAELIGKPSSVRAVANANGKNKISIILPCHRVIGIDGSLTGYGGGIWRKKKLLDFEKEQIEKLR
ncbi:methylated-DNA--[protein]-cysteine S-methyltransferase [Bacteroides sp. 214]|uniref:methylated-DNA--[protein]-cysteine S-methyltransferase n=1 Tax=Bacteroides sp. 214 TaxID=2302935 RepID=UPI0013D275C3|nr:methylated-DNA--[protein]-cysteine S-methyltransferase [Bacteroides sp. 214]NDW13477.1 methylated-DNA--[protein]-cysteine S-methyltransferase [Bacteroides sp. 214]